MMKKLSQAPSFASNANGCEDPVYTGVLTNSILEDDSSPQWDDTFFDDEEDVIEVFDFDYPLKEDFGVKSGLVQIVPNTLACGGFSLTWIFVIFMISHNEPSQDQFIEQVMYPVAFVIAIVNFFRLCLLRRNIQWNVYSQHLCVTLDGIRFVQDKRKSCFGWACTDMGKTSKTVPFDKITDCDIQEPAGNTCCCVKNVLYTIKIDTASSGARDANGIAVPELAISGLKDPYRFKKLVWAMKRSTASHAAPAEQVAIPVVVSQTSQPNEISQLLKEVRDALQEQTKMLQKNALKETEMV